MYIFDKPIRKTGYYIIPIRRLNEKLKLKQSAEINVRSCRLTMCEPLPKQRGSVLAFYIDRSISSYQAIMDIDNQALNAVISGNSEWFKNSLTSSEIEEFWRPSLTHQNSIVIETPVLPADVLQTVAVGHDVTVTFIAHSIFIRPQGFQIQWRIKLMTPVSKDVHVDEDDIDINKNGIEEYWERNTSQALAAAEEKIMEYRERLAKLEEFKKTATNLIQDAKAEKEVTARWNECLTTLESRILDFKAGR